MVTLVLTACPAGLRGHLTRWLAEVSPGVFVGRVNARLREELWSLVIELVKDGKAIMISPDRGAEQGFSMRVHRHGWEVVDVDGVQLVQRPRVTANTARRRGWSTESHLRRQRRK